MIPCPEPLMLSGQAGLSMRRKWYAVRQPLICTLRERQFFSDYYPSYSEEGSNDNHDASGPSVSLLMAFQMQGCNTNMFVFTAWTRQFLHIQCLSCNNGRNFRPNPNWQSYGIVMYTALSSETQWSPYKVPSQYVISHVHVWIQQKSLLTSVRAVMFKLKWQWTHHMDDLCYLHNKVFYIWYYWCKIVVLWGCAL